MSTKPVISVEPHSAGWAVKEGAHIFGVQTFKEDAVNQGRKIAKRRGQDLVIRRKDGTFQDRRSY